MPASLKGRIIDSQQYDGKRATVEHFTDDPLRCLIPQKSVDAYRLMEVLEMRCPDRHNANIEKFLESIDLDHYDVLGILKHTHGLQRSDYLWVRFDDEPINYDDIKIRE